MSAVRNARLMGDSPVPFVLLAICATAVAVWWGKTHTLSPEDVAVATARAIEARNPDRAWMYVAEDEREVYGLDRGKFNALCLNYALQGGWHLSGPPRSVEKTSGDFFATEPEEEATLVSDSRPYLTATYTVVKETGGELKCADLVTALVMSRRMPRQPLKEWARKEGPALAKLGVIGVYQGGRRRRMLSWQEIEGGVER